MDKNTNQLELTRMQRFPSVCVESQTRARITVDFRHQTVNAVVRKSNHTKISFIRGQQVGLHKLGWCKVTWKGGFGLLGKTIGGLRFG